jgi:hypothetical protein
MITLLLLIPIIGSLCLVPLKELDSRELVGAPELLKIQNENRKQLMKQIALITSIVNLIVAIFL